LAALKELEPLMLTVDSSARAAENPIPAKAHAAIHEHSVKTHSNFNFLITLRSFIDPA
jgi:hypothetical protein